MTPEFFYLRSIAIGMFFGAINGYIFMRRKNTNLYDNSRKTPFTFSAFLVNLVPLLMITIPLFIFIGLFGFAINGAVMGLVGGSITSIIPPYYNSPKFSSEYWRTYALYFLQLFI